ncbi:MAG TPA: phasin family protein [Plasticicumulans sp.]|nr:phasin family protein [Plasticicumulans sp.]
MATAKSTFGKEQLQDLLEKTKSSSHEVLLAGLGALSRAGKGEANGKKKRRDDFAALVEEGRKIEPKLKASMQKAWSGLKEKGSKMPSPGFESGKLQGVFEERVSAALARMGIPTRKEIKALNQKVDRLIAAAQGRPAAKKAAPAKKSAAAGKSAAAKKSGARKTAAAKKSAAPAAAPSAE